jgi:hypothetical protein
MPNQKPIAALDSEQEVLGAILNQPNKLVDIIDLLTPDDFYGLNHGHIFKAMTELLEADIPIDFSTLFSNLAEKGLLEKIGGRKFIIGLVNEVGFGTPVMHHAQVVHDKSTLRRLKFIALTIAKNCENGKGTNTRELVETARNMVNEILEGAHFKGGKNIAKRIRNYAEVTEGNFEVTRCLKEVGLVTTSNKKAGLMALGRLVKEGFLSRIKPGIYRLSSHDAPRLKLTEARQQGDEIAMYYPLGFENYFITYPKSVILFSGEPDSGKTAMLLNVARMNMHLGPIYYWTSEMGLSELYSRCEKFEGFNPEVWDEQIIFAERDTDFADVVNLYPDAIHIIDNLEMHDDFYKVGGLIDSIWKALNRGVAVIGLHKDPGKVYPQGGMAALKRPRLVIDLKPKKGGGNIAEVTKAKNWRDQMVNIKGKVFEYRLVKGCKIIEWE